MSRASTTGGTGPTGTPPTGTLPAGTLETSLWRAVAVFRLLTLAYAVGVNLYDLPNAAGPAALLAVLALLAGWSGLSIWAYPRAGRWRPLVLAADAVITLLAIGSTVFVESPERIAAGEPTVPMVWSACVVLAWGLAWGVAGGLAAATLVSLANMVQRGGASDLTLNNIVLLFLAGAVVGYVASLGRRAERTLAEGVRMQAATAERERIGRHIHDGVLQVLALVQRRGAGLGGDGAELARLAGEQEVALRAFVTSRQSGPRDDGRVDLRALLADPSPHVHLSAPATAVLLPAGPAAELAAAVRAALHNVTTHVGPEAEAWVLVEDTGPEVVVTVRDDGPGIPPGRLAAAAAEGRLGVAQSVLGRIRDLDGTAEIVTAPGQGTEVELRVPRR